MYKAIKAVMMGLCLAISTFGAIAASANDYPANSIQLIIPYAPGGSSDILGRVIADELGKRMGVTVVAINRSGAGGSIGISSLKLAKPDGYTLLLGANGPMVISPHLQSGISYDSAKDFTPLDILATAPNVLLVNKNVSANSVQELLDLARKEPLSFASPGLGTTGFLNGEMLRSMANIPLLHVPYKGGAPASVDLNAGRVTMMFDTLPSALANLRQGYVRPLGVTSNEKVDVLKDVPPVSDTIPGFGVETWYALFAPVGMAEPVTQKLNESVRALAEDSTVVNRLKDLGFVLKPAQGEDTRQRIEREFKDYGKLLKEAGVLPE